MSIFDYLFVDIADPRVHDWPFMSNPWKIIAIIGIYLYMIYVYLPSFMSDKKPYSLKGIIVVYNIFQLFACITIIYGLATSGWTTRYRLICEPVDYSENAMAVRMASYMWWTLLLKMTELLETIIFVLRKKYNQVSSLHVYHHISTLSAAWIVCKYVPGGLVTFTPIVNSFIHIFMYSYYLLSTLSRGPKMQKILMCVKSRLTMLQLVQLVIITLQSVQIFLPGCAISNVIGFLGSANGVINVLFFIHFYNKNYVKKKMLQSK
ncbi:elongation of very long chain fatty acids protein-like [Photinus pyralis]|uniref:elongation of very long chain fatty acids protein-like n=1 Tax=Photinus pyralis TaxID=7054 RepID=UPI001267421A|nr:elongation of very long chain fatty acids protein-like [Photinus pyralis]